VLWDRYKRASVRYCPISPCAFTSSPRYVQLELEDWCSISCSQNAILDGVIQDAVWNWAWKKRQAKWVSHGCDGEFWCAGAYS